jgi:3-hydroxyacyl-CoA dehydrogenase
MGARIAAHFANAGYPVDLLDISTTAAQAGLESATKQKPAAFFTDAARSLITPGSFDDNLDGLSACEWIIEAVVERLDIKQQLLAKAMAVRTPGAILSTNTSGIPLARISEGFDAELRQHFLGTHFFNPPRYLHLVELIPGAETAPEVLQWVSEFCDLHLGKGIVPCRDTPNFIGNRIGAFFAATLFQLTSQHDLTIEEVDALTGSLIGAPNSATYRLADIVGLDVWAHVLNNLRTLAPADPGYYRYLPPEFLAQMVERGWLGEKRGQGFYKRVGPEREIHAIDWKTLEYHPARKPKFASVESARNIEDLPQRLRALVAAKDRAGTFVWSLFRDLFLYAARMVPEIADRIVEIDRAMRWGYAYKLGPFELWDALGFVATAQRMRAEGYELPENIERMLGAGAQSFYQAADRASTPRTLYFDLCDPAYEEVEERAGVLVLSEIRRAQGVVRGNAGASLVDLGDGVLCLEFHSKMNTLGEDMIEMLHAGLDETARNFEALVIGNQGDVFSAGANLTLILLAAQDDEWDVLDRAVRRFQKATMAIKYAAKPVVAAPFGMALGGGCEVALHAARVQSSAETYMGLVEVGVGVVPAGGGCKEMLLRLASAKAAFELIGYAKVSTSAQDARQLGLLGARDAISMNPERLLGDAKQTALSLVAGYAPGKPREDIPVEGEAGYAMLKMMLYLAREGAYISEYDAVVGEKLAYVLSGGKLTGRQTVSEQYLLDLEREAFLSLCGQPKTQQRMEHMLKTGKPLRN